VQSEQDVNEINNLEQKNKRLSNIGGDFLLKIRQWD